MTVLKIDLYDPEINKTVHYEQPRTTFGSLKETLAFNKKIAKQDARRSILQQKLYEGTLSDKEAKEYVDLTGNDDEQLDELEDLVIKIFNNPKINKESLEIGLEADGIKVLQGILTDAMGGAEADSKHPAKK